MPNENQPTATPDTLSQRQPRTTAGTDTKPKRTLPAGAFVLSKPEGVTGTALDAAINTAKERRPSDKISFGSRVGTRTTTGVHTFAGYKRIEEGPNAGGYDKTTALVIPAGAKPHEAVEVPTADLFDVDTVETVATETLAKERQAADVKK